MIFIIIIGIIIILKIIQHFYVRYSVQGQQWLVNKKKDKEYNSLVENYIVENENESTDIIEQNNNIIDKFSSTIENLNHQIDYMESLNKEDSSNNYVFNMECKFSIDEPYKLLHASENFLKLLGTNSIEELQRKYLIKDHLKSNSTNNSNNSITLSSLLDDNYSNINYVITFKDLFKVTNTEYQKVSEVIKNNPGMSLTIIRNGRIELQTNIPTLYVKLLYNLYIQNNELIMKFCVYKLLPKVDSLVDNVNTSLYKDVMNNLIMDLPFPFIFVNKNGLKFINKTACDWFNIPYNKIETLQENNESQLTIEYLFDRVDKKLTELIKNAFSANDIDNGFYKKYTIDDLKVTLEQSDITLKNIPNEIIVQCKPFLNLSNRKELFITIQNADIFYSFLNSQDIIQENEIERNKYIESISKYNDFFKSFFSNIQTVSFGRVNLKDKSIVICNELFEDLVRYDNKKDRYCKIIDYIVSSYNEHTDKNFYTYDIMYKDKIIEVLYTYTTEYVDILILENFTESYGSSNSIGFLKNIYNTSNLPIIIVDKNAEIIFANNIFINHYDYDPKQISEHKVDSISLLDLVPELDKRKVKRAIYDAIKFNSYNLKDTITLMTKDKKYQCKLLCIKTYGKIESEEFITITIFPQNLIEKEEHNL